jgi:drug/metabolite transporter (DMT)-like permease
MTHQTSGHWRLGLTLSLLTAFLWGVLPVALKMTLQVLDIYTIVWFRFSLAFVLLGAYLFTHKKLPTPQQIFSAPIKLLIITTIFLCGNYILFMQGIALTTANNTEVLIQLAGVLFGLGGLVIFKERYTLWQWLGISILTLGFLLFFKSQISNLITSQGQYLLGSGLVILGAISWAIYALAQKELLQSLSSPHIMLIVYGGCALLLTPFAKITTVFTLDLASLSVLIFCGLNTLIAYGAFAESLEHCLT